MNSNRVTLSVFWFLIACGNAPPPVVPADAPLVAPTATTPPAPSASSSPPAASAAPEASAPKQNAEDALPADKDYADADATAKTETDRFTPELRARAKALADANYPTARAGLTAALKSPHRKPGAEARDQYRHPVETLEFLGFTPKMTVLEYGPGEGWYTELLAPVLAKHGKLIVTTADPNGPKGDRGTLGAHRLALFLDKSPELFGKVERVVVDSKNPSLPEDGTVDLALVFRSLHGMHRGHSVPAWLTAIHRALKPHGVLGIEQHRAKPGTNPDETAERGYLPEAWVIDQVERAGFKLVAKSELNANPKDYPEGVWTLPPTFRLKDKDRDRYAAIGESDRMTLKFVKVEAGESPKK